jgi:DNA polymerase III epsilon subunit-like protein
MINYYVIDTETTGLKSNYHEMTEIGIIRAIDRVQLWRIIKCEHPERANFDALKITNKTMDDLISGRNKEDVVAECDKFFNEDGLTPAHRCIICHNTSFDKKFLHALWALCGKEFPANLWLDSIALTRAYAKQIGLIKPKVNLHAACDIVGIKKISEAHNAKVDSRNTYLLWKNLVEEKNIDYLPFIKTFVHSLSQSDENDGLDPSLLD